METPTNSIEGTVIVLVQWLKLGIETLGVALVAIGVLSAVAQLSACWLHASLRILLKSA
jgi:hypothetical protein